MESEVALQMRIRSLSFRRRPKAMHGAQERLLAVSFIVAEMGRDADPFMLQLFAALAGKERSLISEHTKAARAARKRPAPSWATRATPATLPRSAGRTRQRRPTSLRRRCFRS